MTNEAPQSGDTIGASRNLGLHLGNFRMVRYSLRTGPFWAETFAAAAGGACCHSAFGLFRRLLEKINIWSYGSGGGYAALRRAKVALTMARYLGAATVRSTRSRYTRKVRDDVSRPHRCVNGNLSQRPASIPAPALLATSRISPRQSPVKA